MAYRLRRVGLPFVDLSMDMANAFPCTPHSLLNEISEQRAREADLPFFLQKRDRLFVEVPTPDGGAAGRATSGSPMGDNNAPDEFKEAFHRVVSAWQMEQEVAQVPLYMRCPLV